MRVAWLGLPLIACLACGSEDNDAAKSNTLLPDSNVLSIQEKKEMPEGPYHDTVPPNIQVDTVIQLAMPDGVDQLSAVGTINKKSSPVICMFQVKQPQRIQARLVSRSPGLQVRFSEIIFPDKHIEGPFGQQIEHNLSTPGLYQFIITPHSMAGSKKSGDFLIELRKK